MIDTARPKPKSPTPNVTPKGQARSLLRIHRPVRARTTQSPLSPGSDNQLDLELANKILARIESRLPGRLRELTVFSTENAVVLTGQCCTFYTKQLAQHIAMGVLEYEQLINNIEVQVAK